MSIGFGHQGDPRADAGRPDAGAAPALGTRRLVAVASSSPPRSRRASAAGEVLREPAPAGRRRAPPAAPTAELVQLRQQLEQARMGLRVADARSQELEKQIDALNQKLTESQDELTFFRKAREGKKH